MNRALKHYYPKSAPVESLLSRVENPSAVHGLSLTTVAVITAAVAAVMGPAAPEFQITSIKQHSQIPQPAGIWSQAGKFERMTARQKFFERRGK